MTQGARAPHPPQPRLPRSRLHRFSALSHARQQSQGRTFVVDAKYKADESARNADLYQMLAYCTALQSHLGILVYADAPDDVICVQGAGIEVRVFSLGLDKEPDEILRRVGAVRDAIMRAAVPISAAS